jgi:putative ABC transport system permease protein
MRAFSPGMLALLGIRLVRGRHLEAGDGARAPRVALVNEAMVRRHFAGQSPIGRRLRPHVGGDLYYEIIGVVADVRQLGPAAEVYPEVIMPIAQFTGRSFALIVETAADAAAVATAIRAQVRALDPHQPFYSVRTMEELLGERIARPRFTMVLLIVFAGTAAALAAIGLYGLISYSVTRRRHEVGVRMALGARPADILGMVLRQGLGLAVVGLGLGVAGAVVLTRWMESLLFQVSALDPITYGAIAALLLVVCVTASYLPARRAMRTEPVRALRE